jgi:exodeoxyribonuclease V beta subunit
VKTLDPLAVSLAGTHLVEASAGTGKTFTIAILTLRLVVERRIPISRVLVVTYTNAATAELRGRIRSRLRGAFLALKGARVESDLLLAEWIAARREQGLAAGDASWLEEQVRAFDEAPIFTIHGFCQRILQEHAFESGTPFDAELAADLSELREEVLLDLWEREICARPGPVARLVARALELRNLRGLVASALRDRNARLLPVAPAVGLDEAFLGRWSAAQRKLAEIWSAERVDIVSKLASPALNQNSYRPKTILTRWVPEIDRFLESGSPDSTLDADILRKLTSEGIEKGRKKGEIVPKHRFFAAASELQAVEGELAERTKREVVRIEHAIAEGARVEIERRKEAAGVQSFDDLLHRLAAALREDEKQGGALAAGIGQRYEAALIDEFQDTDPVQIEIFRRVFHGRRPLYLIGDPKQSIYSFRGADLHAYVDARKALGAEEHTLGSNWRSDPQLVTAVNALFRSPAQPFLLESIAFEPARAEMPQRLFGAGVAPLRVLFVRRDGRGGGKNYEQLITQDWSRDGIPALVACEVSRLLSSGATIRGDDGKEQKVGPGDVAVLCRTNAHLATVREALRRLGVPAVIQGATSVLDDPEAEEMERILDALADPSDPQAIRAALATSLLGRSGNDIFDLRKNDAEWERWVLCFREWHETWLRHGFAAAFRRLLEVSGGYARLAASARGERGLTNFLHLAELAEAEEMSARRGPLALVEWLRRVRQEKKAPDELGEDARRIRLESDVHAVKLVTVHKSKGLEWPIVFCPDLWAGAQVAKSDEAFPRFHRTRKDGGAELAIDLGTEEIGEHREIAAREVLAERLRLLYVAATRAKHHCTIVWGHFNEAESSPLAYLLGQADGFAALDDDAMLAGVALLARGGAGAIGVEEVVEERRGLRYEPPRAPAEELLPREFTGSIRGDWRVSSFSALVAHDERLSRPAEEGQDHHDEGADAPQILPVTPAVQIPLFDFPAGPNAGNCLHSLLEKLDFVDANVAAVAERAAELLPRFGLARERAQRLAEAVVAMLDTELPVDGGTIALRNVTMARRRSEMEFILPVASGDRIDPLTAAKLAAAFRDEAKLPQVRAYAERVAALCFMPLSGHLKGFVDLVFEHGGRWYLLDWKSNRLGLGAADYAAALLEPEMARHDYFLQYHLYAVALHRHLETRLRGYRYEQHFGGVLYLFVRGVHPSHPPGTGVFFDRPPRGLIERLSAALGSMERAA